MSATVLTCPAPHRIGFRPDIPGAVSSKRLNHYACLDPVTGFDRAWQVQSAEAGQAVRETMTLEDVQLIMPAILMALVVATGYRWLINMIRNR